jgi:Tfp pilus assembly protein FimT
MTLQPIRTDRGFTLPEVLITVAFFIVVSAVSLAGVSAALPTLRVDGQVSRLMGLLQMARETAVARQRDVEIRFDVPNHRVTLIRHEPNEEVPIQMITFESNVIFTQFDGMGDTPEGYGSNDPVDFGGADPLLFISDGTLVDGTGIPTNGTIYLGIEEHRETARAITITGSTARARFYKWIPANETWEGGWTAR